MALVTVTTDFGTVDGYVGEVKGVLLSGGASATVDVTQEVPAGDVRAGAWVLHRIWSRYPPGTVHLTVVDPGVGGGRRAVAARAGDRWFVGPDNGLLTWVLRRHGPDACRELDPERVGLDPVSDTFHGRDLFAPAAARVAAEGAEADLGPRVPPDDLVRFQLADARREGDVIRGEVWHVDVFGNLITNVPADWLPRRPAARVGDREIRGIRGSYAGVEPGELLLTRGSVGTLEISVRDGSAAGRLDVSRGASVEVRGEGGTGAGPSGEGRPATA